MADKLAGYLKSEVAPILSTNGVLRKPGDTKTARNVKINGIDSRFGGIAGTSDIFNQLTDEEIVINEALAQQLALGIGDEIVLRFTDSGFLPGDTPIAGGAKNIKAARFKITGIVNEKQLGNFNLRINQIAAPNVFISIKTLGEKLNLDDHANIILISDNDSGLIDEAAINRALHHEWDITDAGFDLVFLETQQISELRSKSIFIDKEISQTIVNSDLVSTPVLTYFVNALSANKRSTPYSFVSAIGKPLHTRTITNSEIVVNQWLADDLNLNIGDSLTMSYFIPGPNATLIEKSGRYEVGSIVPLKGKYADRELMPDFPGLADVDNCRLWEPGIPIDLDLIREKDEMYWDQYRGIPKAYISLNAGQSIWENRFGNCTAIRFKSKDITRIKQELSALITPENLGIIFRPVRQEGLIAGAESVDFSELFFGLSFFIIVAALLLTSLIYRLNIENRMQETGLYFALGFRPATVLKIMFFEGIVIALISSAIGCLLSVLYTKIVLTGLNTVWQGAIGTSTINLHLNFSAILSGFFISIFIVLFTIFISVYRYAKANTIALQRANLDSSKPVNRWRSSISLIIAIVSISSALIIILMTDAGRGKEAAASFFASGFLTLTGGLALLNFLLFRTELRGHLNSIFRLAMQNSNRNRTRSLTLVGMLASSLFIIFTVGANRTAEITDMSNRNSGTGGFSLFGEISFPMNYDLNTQDGREFLNLANAQNDDIKFVQFRLREGDDASCLNLNRISEPKILGLNPAELSQREAFGFLTKIPDLAEQNPWAALDTNYANNVIPGIADETVIIWGLGKSVGDTISYMDEKGRTLRIKLIAGLANSIFQGHIIISEKNFLNHFPSISGYRIFLAETETDSVNQLADKISWTFQDYGLTLQTTARRLSEFNKVENTYLSIFLILGSFAIILGTFGLGLVVFRNVLERRNELAILRAVGYKYGLIRKLVLVEHFWLLTLGILLGLFSSLISTLPSLLSINSESPVMLILVILFFIFVSGLIWTFLATSWAIKGNLNEALRND